MISRLKVAVSLFGVLTFAFNFAPDVFAQLSPSITTTTITPGVVGVPYSATVTGTGGTRPYSWSATGMPSGFSINPSSTDPASAVITGTPNSACTFPCTFTVAVTLRDFTNRSAQKSFTLTIYTPLSLTTESLPPGTVDTDYPNTNLTATGGATPYAWKVLSGSLPDGLNLSGGGRIDGKPKNAAIGTTTFTVQVADNGVQTASKVLSITVAQPLSITTGSPLPTGTLGMSYSQNLAATGGTPPLTWSVTSGAPPGGLMLSSAGVISGTPTGAGMTNFTVQVADSASPARTATKAFTLTIMLPPLSITTSSPLPNGAVDTAYSQTLATSGGVPGFTWSVTSGTPPAGLTLSAAGVLSGTPSTPATTNFTVQVRDNASQTATKQFAITIDPPPLTITTPSPLSNGTVGTGYSQTLAATGGTPPYAWSVTTGTLPAGLTLSGAAISGTPTTAVAANFTIQVRDSASRTATKAFAITVISTTFTLTIVPDTMQPAQQVAVGLTVSSAQSNPVSGSLTLSFTSSAVVPSDDPAVTFSNGKTVNFTIPANSTAAVFPSGTMLMTGTVSGTIVVKANIQNGVTDVPVKTVTVPATIPKLTNITAVRISGGLRVQATGYSPERRVNNVDFAFDVKTSSGTQRVTLSRSVQTEFDTWYRSGASSAFGSTFTFEQMFTVQGDSSGINGVTVTLTNGQGSGSLGTTTFTSN
jgi:Putative Ig domain